ncbi:MAG TPA: hypothetical protein VH165_02775 [Kofleriaceae bacterium]|nr:hypothetical protein [Kofleriaceae bacterium]
MLAAIAATAAPARADSHTEAVVLFDQGIKDLRAGRIDKACNELQSSLELVKDSGTKGALARCNGLAGRVATAWILWRELADTAPKPDLRSDAAAQAAKLEARLPRYTLKIAAPMDDLVVEINGRGVASNMLVPVPIDPGKLTVTAVRRNGDRDISQLWSHEYAIAEGQTLAIEIPKLAVAAKPGPAAVVPVHGPEVSSDVEQRRHRRHVLAAVLGAVAIGAGGVSGYFGYDASSKYSDAKTSCNGMITQCPGAGLRLSAQQVADARSSANVSTGVGIGAGALALVAIIVWATAPSLEQKPVAIAPTVGTAGTTGIGSVGIVLGGAF